MARRPRIGVMLTEDVSFRNVDRYGQPRELGWLRAGETILLMAETPSHDKIDALVGEPAGYEDVDTAEGPCQIRRRDALRLRRGVTV